MQAGYKLNNFKVIIFLQLLYFGNLLKFTGWVHSLLSSFSSRNDFFVNSGQKLRKSRFLFLSNFLGFV